MGALSKVKAQSLPLAARVGTGDQVWKQRYFTSIIEHDRHLGHGQYACGIAVNIWWGHNDASAFSQASLPWCLAFTGGRPNAITSVRRLAIAPTPWTL